MTADRQVQDRAERLRLAIRGAGGNKAVAVRSEVPLSTLTSYLKGRDMPAAVMVSLADATDVRLEWLATGREPREPIQFATFEEVSGAPAADQSWVAGARPAVDRLRQAISEAGGPAVVAQRVNLDVPRIAYYLRSDELLLHPDLVVIASACGVSLEWLATGARPSETSPPGQEPDLAIIAKFLELSYALTNKTGQEWSMERRLRWAWSCYLNAIEPDEGPTCAP